MSYTSFGEFMRILRIKHHEVMGIPLNFLMLSHRFYPLSKTEEKRACSVVR